MTAQALELALGEHTAILLLVLLYTAYQLFMGLLSKYLNQQTKWWLGPAHSPESGMRTSSIRWMTPFLVTMSFLFTILIPLMEMLSPSHPISIVFPSMVSNTAPPVIASEHCRVFRMWYFKRAGERGGKGSQLLVKGYLTFKLRISSWN